MCTSDMPVACQAGARPYRIATTNVVATREHQHALVEGERNRQRQQTRRNQRRRGLQNRRADRHAEHTAERREHQAFGEQLTDDARSSGAERRSDRELTRPRVGAGQQQVGDVRAAHQQDERDDAEQQQRGRGAARGWPAAHAADPPWRDGPCSWPATPPRARSRWRPSPSGQLRS